MHGMSRKTITRIGVSGVCALAIVGAVASTASAKGSKATYTVSVGSVTSGTAALSNSSVGGHTASNPDLSFTDLRSGLPAACNSATTKGAAKLSTTAAAKSIATVTSQVFTGCESDQQLDLAVAPSGTWTFVASGATSGGVTKGTLTKIKAAVHDTDGFGCKFTIGGTVDAAYSNSSHQLTLSSTSHDLVISAQSGNCLTLAMDKDKVSLSSVFTVASTSPSGVLTVQSN